uniref:Uncharacterized protein n=1 Tax=Arundo donax TaxID=35708 RepID=A0A0A9S8K8_ARUDO
MGGNNVELRNLKKEFTSMVILYAHQFCREISSGFWVSDLTSSTKNPANKSNIVPSSHLNMHLKFW